MNDWLVLGPSAVAIAVAIIGAITQVLSRRAEDRRLASQREADDKRWREQREADDTRQVREHEQVVAREARADEVARVREHTARLRDDATAFLKTLGEAHVAAQNIKSLLRRTPTGDVSEAGKLDAGWTSDLQARLAIATAGMQLYGGAVGEAAVKAQRDLHSAVDQLLAGSTLLPTEEFDSNVDAFLRAYWERWRHRRDAAPD